MYVCGGGGGGGGGGREGWVTAMVTKCVDFIYQIVWNLQGVQSPKLLPVMSLTLSVTSRAIQWKYSKNTWGWITNVTLK